MGIVFGKTGLFVCPADDDTWYAVLETVQTVEFVSYFHAFNVQDLKPCLTLEIGA